jgi:hypothetical protein
MNSEVKNSSEPIEAVEPVNFARHRNKGNGKSVRACVRACVCARACVCTRSHAGRTVARSVGGVNVDAVVEGGLLCCAVYFSGCMSFSGLLY